MEWSAIIAHVFHIFSQKWPFPTNLYGVELEISIIPSLDVKHQCDSQESFELDEFRQMAITYCCNFFFPQNLLQWP